MFSIHHLAVDLAVIMITRLLFQVLFQLIHTDIEGDGFNIGPQVYFQDGSSPWSGIQIFGIEADSVRRGDKLTVTGIVNENFGVTRIGTLDNGVLQFSQTGTGLADSTYQ